MCIPDTMREVLRQCSAEAENGTLAGTQLQESDGSVIVENCRAEGISMNGTEKDGAVGGIAGCAKKAYLIDNAVITQNGVSDRIQGKGYVGRIAGVMTLSGIYNSYVNGTIGGNGSLGRGRYCRKI